MRILIIEDDELLARALQFGLEKDDHQVTYFTEGKKGQQQIESDPDQYDLLILDWLLPDKTGLAICTELREKSILVPILMLTGKESSEDKVLALNAGADDYLTKPFALPELFARLKALARRPKNVIPNEIRLGDMILNTDTKKISRQGQVIPLTLKEFAILEYLMRHPNQVLTREQILDHVWDFNFDSFSNIVDVHINNLRKKINNGSDSNILETIRGVGYCVKVAV
jgi:DNA-binding response OmpR family regulator